jgi:hypothetical protein
MIIAAVAVLVGVFYAATGRGGELAYEHADHAPLDLGPVSAGDVAMLRPPTALWGYNMQVTDEALERIAHAMRDRDVTIAYLRQQLAGQGSDAAPSPDAPLTPSTAPQFSLASQTAQAPEFPAASQTVPAPQDPPPAGAEQPPGPKHARPRAPWSYQDPPSSPAPVPDAPAPAEPAAPAAPAGSVLDDSAAAPAAPPGAQADDDAMARAEEQSW